MSPINHLNPYPILEFNQKPPQSVSTMALTYLQNPFNFINHCATHLGIVIEEPTNGNAGWYTPAVMNFLTVLVLLVLAEGVVLVFAWGWRRWVCDLERRGEERDSERGMDEREDGVFKSGKGVGDKKADFESVEIDKELVMYHVACPDCGLPILDI